MKKPKTYSEAKETLWLIWFLASFIVFIVYFIIGTMEDSRIIFPNWDIFFGIVVVNLIYCCYVGFKPRET